MQCPRCQTTNPNQARFCFGCGYSLVNGIVCTACHTLLPIDARYCFNCGAVVISPSQASSQMDDASEGSRIANAIAAPETDLASIDQDAPRAYLETRPLDQLPPARPVGDMLPSLGRYLPEALYEPLERRPNEGQLKEVGEHLGSLLETAKTYLPRPVVVAPQPAGVPAGGMYRGVFLFGDVSGFTPLSEQLKKLGQVGAERIAEIINELFYDMVTILFDHGGTLLKFGGDALLGLFPADSDEEMAAMALKATQAALAMQMSMEKYGEIEAAGEMRALRIKCGISSGPYFAAHIGTKPAPKKNHYGTMAYVTTGHTVNRAEQAEGHAEPGDVVISKDALDLLNGQAKTEKINDDFFRVKDISPQADTSSRFALNEPPEGETVAQITYLVDRLDRLTPYLSPELTKRIVNNPGNPRLTPENRPVTVMFANYVGISDLIEDMGETRPELVTNQLNNYFVHMAEVVEHYEGTLARMDQYSVGDRLVIFFGAPRAHEDDPRRAVQTALEMQDAVQEHFSALQTPAGIYRFRQRIGINTGTLFAGNAGAPNLRQEYTLMGDDINMAARLMSSAGWQEIFVSKRTHDRVAAFFEMEDQGELKVKGKEILIPTFKAIKRRREIGRTRGLGTGGTPLVGREDQVEAIRNYTRELLAGRGRIITVIGESGLGKTRFKDELKNWLLEGEDREVKWLEGNAVSFSEQVSYWLAAQFIYEDLDLPPDANQNDVLFTLWEKGEDLMGKETAREAIPFLAYLLNLELEGEWEALVNDLDPKVRQKQIFWAAREFFKTYAQGVPSVIVLDDLHYADEASLALFEDLLSIANQSPVMFIFSFRPRRDKGCWHLRDEAASKYHHRYAEIPIEPLDDQSAQTLLETLLPGAIFSPQTLKDILDKTTGNPFYLEEVVRSLMDSGAVIPDEELENNWVVTDKIEAISVPDTLQGAIIARIDRLTEDARQALQKASVIGRRFQMKLLGSLAKTDADLSGWLGQLEHNELIKPDPGIAESVYFFPDAMVQEVAYDNLLVQSRHELHYSIGLLLEKWFYDQIAARQGEDADPDIVEELLAQESEMLAYHFGLSDDRERAAKYLEIAGKKARNDYALKTALSHYGKLLEIKRQSEDQAGQASALYTLGVMAYEMGDYQQGEIWLSESVEILRKLEDQASEGWSVMYLGMIDLKRANYDQAKKHHQYALDMAKERKDEFQEGIHLTNLGRVAMRLGDYAASLKLFNRSLKLKAKMNDLPGQGFARFYIGMVALFLGEDDKAAVELEAALKLWQETIKNKRGVSYCLYGLGLLSLNREQFEEAERYFQQASDINTELVLNAEIVESLSFLGQARMGLGRLDEALEASEKALEKLAQQKDVEEEQQIYLNHYYVLKALNNDQADEFLEKAYQEMQDQAERISGKKDKQKFLTGVMVNQKIAAALEG